MVLQKGECPLHDKLWLRPVTVCLTNDRHTTATPKRPKPNQTEGKTTIKDIFICIFDFVIIRLTHGCVFLFIYLRNPGVVIQFFPCKLIPFFFFSFLSLRYAYIEAKLVARFPIIYIDIVNR